MVIWQIPRLKNLGVRQQFWESGCPDSHLIYTLNVCHDRNAGQKCLQLCFSAVSVYFSSHSSNHPGQSSPFMFTNAIQAKLRLISQNISSMCDIHADITVSYMNYEWHGDFFALARDNADLTQNYPNLEKQKCHGYMQRERQFVEKGNLYKISI